MDSQKRCDVCEKLYGKSEKFVKLKNVFVCGNCFSQATNDLFENYSDISSMLVNDDEGKLEICSNTSLIRSIIEEGSKSGMVREIKEPHLLIISLNESIDWVVGVREDTRILDCNIRELALVLSLRLKKFVTFFKQKARFVPVKCVDTNGETFWKVEVLVFDGMCTYNGKLA